MDSSEVQQHNKTAIDSALEIDVVVIGAGFAGLYALYKFRGMGKSCCSRKRAGPGTGTVTLVLDVMLKA
ncbi:ribulose 1,5-bisphosphate synthetase/thiazole synthase [Zhongshania antarctica]|uniref:Ribulose 1,5-bisphosphate synthetase/thiazole synthase n=1 Tax=Zhongshania antarctica TaxID=641702 RepID=A0A840R9A1_9GAMM|nr:ribulose 1,5-bisphosphate synthetase/thiazole synthase [Zhongshania antarctica]